MATDLDMSGDYFDTPARAERLQLLLHLVRNAGEVLYLRAPVGAGKTRFAHQLLDILGDEMATVWVRAEKDSDIPSAAADQLGLPADIVTPWPDALMAALDGQDLLVIVDEADALGLDAVERLAHLHARGGRLLLIGRGGLAQTDGNWDVQFVDLPAFDAVQTMAFLRTQAGEQAARVTDDLAAGLHRAAKGLPGPLLDALIGVLGSAGTARRAERAGVQTVEDAKGPLWPWAFGGLVLIVLLSVLLFQDQINALFAPPIRPDPVSQPLVVAPQRDAPGMQGPAVAEPAPMATSRNEAVSALMPEIGLPELDQTAAGRDIDPMAVIDPTGPSTAEPAVVDSAAINPETPGPKVAEDPLDTVMQDAMIADAGRADAGPVDPLDAVMQDALAAAEGGGDEGGETVTPAVSETSTGPEAPVRAEAPANTVTPAAVAKPPAAETPPPVVMAPRVPSQAAATTPAEADAGQVPAPVEERSVGGSAPTHRDVELVARDDVPVQPAPAPVESRPQSRSGAAVVKAPTVATGSQAGPGGGEQWLKSREPGRYTLQLVGSRNRASVEKFVRDFRIEAPFAIFKRDLKGRPWYSLIAGDYPDRDAAIAARGRLPERLGRSGVWPRTFESVQKSM